MFGYFGSLANDPNGPAESQSWRISLGLIDSGLNKYRDTIHPRSMVDKPRLCPLMCVCACVYDPLAVYWLFINRNKKCSVTHRQRTTRQTHRHDQQDLKMSKVNSPPHHLQNWVCRHNVEKKRNTGSSIWVTIPAQIPVPATENIPQTVAAAKSLQHLIQDPQLQPHDQSLYSYLPSSCALSP